MRINIAFHAAAAAALSASCAAAGSLEELFESPPPSAGVNVWWHWQGGNVSKAGITRDLESMKKAEVASATIFNIQDIGWDSPKRLENPLCPEFEYMGDTWWDMVLHAISEAKRIGLDIGLHNCPGYSTSGGPWISPENGMKKLVWARKGEEIEKKLGFYRDIAEVETTNGVYRFGYTCTGKCTHPSPPDVETSSLEADKMSAKAVGVHLDHLLDNLAKHGVKASSPGFSFILMDSYEAGDGNWTDDFAEQFKARRGYDPVPFLPVMAGMATSAGAERDEQFRHDRWRTQWELQTERHYALFKSRLNAAGFEFHLEPYYGPFDMFEAASLCDVPMTEFWQGKSLWSKDSPVGGGCWMAGSTGRALGREICGAESFTANALNDPFKYTPRHLKTAFDASMARGLNRLSLHHWEHQPFGPHVKPGLSMGPWGTHFGENATWFESGLPFYAYMHRVQGLLQHGVRRIDLLGVVHTWRNETDALPCSQFLTNVEVVAECKIRVKSSGKTYKALFVKDKLLDPAYKPYDDVEARTIARLRELESAGAKVFSDSTVGKFFEENPRPASLSDESLEKDEKVLFTSRAAEDGTPFYFIANITEEPKTFTGKFTLPKGAHLSAQAWNPDTLEKRTLEISSSRTLPDGSQVAEIPFVLDVEEGVFVVFGAKPLPAGEPLRHAPSAGKAGIGICGWTLEFDAGGGAPEGKIALGSLKSWSEFDEPGIKYYSGSAMYSTKIDSAVLVPGATLDLGEVYDIAEVFIDGKKMATLWHSPYKTAIPPDFKPAGAEAELKIRVTNAWTNRLIGDDLEEDDCVLDEMKKFEAHTVIDKKEKKLGRPVLRTPDWVIDGSPRKVKRFAYSSWRYTEAELQKAGLVGPVSVK